MTQRTIPMSDRHCKSLRLLKVITPLTWGLTCIAVVPSILIFMRPSSLEIVYFYVFQALLLTPTNYLSEKAFLKLYPDTAAFIGPSPCGLSLDERIKGYDLLQRISFLESLFSFPDRLARFAYIGSFLTNIPAFLVILFLWEHDQPIWLRLTLSLCVTALNLGYFYGASFFDAHQEMSRLIGALHEKHDFSEAFSKIRIPYSRDRAHFRELIVFGYMIVFMCALQTLIVLGGLHSSPADLVLKLALVNTTGLLLFAHVWYTARKHLVGGLESIFQRMEVLDYGESRQTLPLHTSPLLANFECTVNTLSRRLSASEQELRSMIDQEAEKSRFRALGEMSALIAHDLSGPLHVAQFCVEELRTNPKKISVGKYLEQLAENVEKAVELINSLRARLKNPSPDCSGTLFKDAHRNVVRLLATQFPRLEFERIAVRLDSEVECVALPIPRVDLIHVLDNLYRNSFENLIRSRIEVPHLEVTLERRDAGSVSILIGDNGTSLSPQDYERLTGPAPAKDGLGLRLTRRLVELHGGSLSLVPTPGRAGTTFRLSLPSRSPSRATRPGLGMKTALTETKFPSSDLEANNS